MAGRGGSGSEPNGCGLLLLIGLIILAVSRCTGGSVTADLPTTNLPDSTGALSSTLRYVQVGSLNCRAEPGRGSARVGRFSSGDAVLVEDTRDGWSRVSASGHTCWVIASSLGASAPVAAEPPPLAQEPPPADHAESDGRSERGSADIGHQPREGPSFQCGSKRVCGQMNSCAEANFYLNQCGLSRLDGDGDGVPCESICR
jgi:hypothetical protein